MRIGKLEARSGTGDPQAKPSKSKRPPTFKGSAAGWANDSPPVEAARLVLGSCCEGANPREVEWERSYQPGIQMLGLKEAIEVP